MNYLNANQLLRQIRENQPRLFSGTVYTDPERGWAVHIGPDTHRNLLFSEEAWMEFAATNLPEGQPLPAEWIHEPSTDPFVPAPLPGWQYWLENRMTSLPRPIQRFLFSRVLAPPFDAITEAIRLLASLTHSTPDHEHWLWSGTIRASYWIPLFPAYVARAIMVHELATIMAPLIADQIQGKTPRAEDPVEGIVIPLPNGGHAHVYTMRAENPKEIERIIRERREKLERNHTSPEE